MPGQHLLVHPSGKKTYALFPRVNGKQVNFTIGYAAVLTLAEARAEAKRQLALIAGGKIRARPSRRPSGPRRRPSRSWPGALSSVTPRSNTRRWRRPSGRSSARSCRAGASGRSPRITQRDVIALLDAIVDRGAPVRPTARSPRRGGCSTGPSSAALIETSPLRSGQGAGAGDEARSRARRFRTGADLAGRRALGYPFGPFIQLLILTGQRREEVAGMRWGELDSDLTHVDVARARVKNNEPHQVPLVPWARSILAGLPRIEGSDFVFTTTGTAPIGIFSGPSTARRGDCGPEWRQADRAVDLARSRRSAATGMARLGVQLPTVEKILNHVCGVLAASRHLSAPRLRRRKAAGAGVLGTASADARSGRARPRDLPESRLPRLGLTMGKGKWMPFAEAVARAESREALVTPLRERRVFARATNSGAGGLAAYRSAGPAASC